MVEPLSCHNLMVKCIKTTIMLKTRKKLSTAVSKGDTGYPNQSGSFAEKPQVSCPDDTKRHGAKYGVLHVMRARCIPLEMTGLNSAYTEDEAYLYMGSRQKGPPVIS